MNVNNKRAYKDVLQFITINEMIMHKPSKVVSIERQVVAGTNYKLLIQTNEEFREVIVWKQINGKMKLMSNEVVARPQ